MNAQAIDDMLKALPCALMRGADRGLPPPTLSYFLKEEKSAWRLTLSLRAALCEDNDGLIKKAQALLEPLGFITLDTKEGEEKDTGIKTAQAVLIRAKGPSILVEGTPLYCLRAEITRKLPAVHVDLSGAWRRAEGGALLLFIALPLLARTAAARRLTEAGQEPLPLTVAGKRCLAYLTQKRLVDERAELNFVLKEENT